LVEVIGQALSSLGKGLVPAFIAIARQLGVPLPAELNDPEAGLPPGRVVGGHQPDCAVIVKSVLTSDN
jgi:hypothetical protein